MPNRRDVLLISLTLPALPVRADDALAEAALRTGGAVLVLRHALAPGTFDPPQFKLGDCSTQRNLNADGRAQAGRIGAWFRQRALLPAQVRSSPWCRCIDTATLAFGRAEPWAALGSPHGGAETVNAANRSALREALAAVPAGRFEVWVTHNFVIADLAAGGAGSGEGLVLRAAAGGVPALLARLGVP